jgi:polysaccharide export outer membrane protein
MRVILSLGVMLSVVTLLLPVAVRPAGAQTPQQLDALMSLPEGERNKLLRQLGNGSAGAGSGPAPGSSALNPGNPLLQQSGNGPQAAAAGNGRLSGESTVIVRFEPRGGGDDLSTFLRELIGKRVYELDRYGVLHLRNIFHIPLAGLSPAQAGTRIESEPGLEVFNVTVEVLPLALTGPDSLDLFGRDFFARARALLIDPATTPVPGDYIIGPGDVIAARLYGADNQFFELTVDREGQMVLPRVGPIAVAGLSLDQLRDELTTRVREQMIGVNATVTMQRLRSVQVFVLGDVEGPGAYTVDGLTTITNALLLSGGVRRNGTLRGVQLKRNGKVARTLDLYDLLLRGDTRNDVRLQNGDVIFVPPIGRTVGIEGAVNRPALYELRTERTVGDLLALAGGLRSVAQQTNARLERIGEGGRRTLIDLDLGSAQDTGRMLRNGDVLRVVPVLEVAEGIVTLAGHVREPRDFEWRPDLRLTDLIPTPDALNPFADTGYVLIRREDAAGRIDIETTDLRLALSEPGGPADLLLRPRDRVFVFELSTDRSGIIGPLVTQLGEQREYGEALPVARIAGEVAIPGRYPVTDGMRVSELVRAAGNLKEAAYTLEAELTRRVLVDGQFARVEFIDVDLAAALAGDRTADIPIEAHDYLTIKLVPELRDNDLVTIGGEVRFPGVYPMKRGETLAQIIERAGGLTDLAFPRGSVFTRVELRAREQKRLDQLAQRLEGDLAAAAVQSAQSEDARDAAESLRIGQELLRQLRGTEATGRLVINLDLLLAQGPGSEQDIVLRDGDRLFIPQSTQEVTVIGEVQFPSSHLHDGMLKRDDYLGLAGGLTAQADKKRIYVVRANGSVVMGSDSKWFRRTGVQVESGDTIIVPLDADRIRPLALWTSISAILYQLGLAAATASAIGVF